MNLSDLMKSMRRDSGRVDVVVGDDWLQGRSIFGGLQAAIALAAMRSLVSSDIPLRTLQMTFVAPVPAGKVSAQARVLRTGKSATHAEARLENSGELLALVVAIFGTARPSLVHRQLPSHPPAPRVRHPLHFIQGITPNFMQHFSVDLLEGALPFSGSAVVRNVFEVSLPDEGATTESQLLALADFVPPVALSWPAQATPGSSLTWMIELLDVDFAKHPAQAWLVEADMVAAADGYTSQSTLIRAPDGTAVALSRQSMVVFA